MKRDLIEDLIAAVLRAEKARNEVAGLITKLGGTPIAERRKEQQRRATARFRSRLKLLRSKATKGKSKTSRNNDA